MYIAYNPSSEGLFYYKKNMKSRERLKIPVSVLKVEVENNSFALLRFFVELFGKINARNILNLLSSENSESTFDQVNKLILSSLREKFNFSQGILDEEIKANIASLYQRANRITNGLVEVSFPEMSLELGLLNTTTVPSINFAKRIYTLMSNGQSTNLYYFLLLFNLSSHTDRHL